MHRRRVFLESLREQLQGLPNYGGVWIQRSSPQRNAYPAITLFSDHETSDLQTVHSPRCMARLLTVAVMVWIRGTPDDEKADIDMDEAAADIELTLRKPVGADDMILVSTDFQYSEDDPEIHAVTLTYRIEYSANEFDPVAPDA